MEQTLNKETSTGIRPEAYRKGELAVGHVYTKLVEMGYVVLFPTESYLPFDLVAYKDGKFLRFQVKFSVENEHGSVSIPSRTICYKYKNTDFDYYGLFVAEKNLVLFPPIAIKGCSIRTKNPSGYKPFYWWADFLAISPETKLKTAKELGLEIRPTEKMLKRAKTSKDWHKKHPEHKKFLVVGSTRKVERPSKDILEKELWETPTSVLSKKYGVTDVAIAKWAKAYGIKKPGRGYWEKLRHADTIKPK